MGKPLIGAKDCPLWNLSKDGMKYSPWGSISSLAEGHLQSALAIQAAAKAITT